MTDNEIIKALECCIVSDDSCSDSCPLRHIEGNCFYILSKPILDLINRQKAEINFAKYINGKTVGKLLSDYEELQNLIQNAKAEAVKEFAERLKAHTRKMSSSDFSGEFWDKAVLVSDIDNLVKEMVGE